MLERKLGTIKESGLEGLLILDLTAVHRCETAVAQYILRKAREYARVQYPKLLCLAGLHQSSGLWSDLVRGGVECSWEERTSLDFGKMASNQAKGVIQTFTQLSDAHKLILNIVPLELGGDEKHFGAKVSQMLANRSETRSMIAKSSHRRSVRKTLLDIKHRMLQESSEPR